MHKKQKSNFLIQLSKDKVHTQSLFLNRNRIFSVLSSAQ